MLIRIRLYSYELSVRGFFCALGKCISTSIPDYFDWIHLYRRVPLNTLHTRKFNQTVIEIDWRGYHRKNYRKSDVSDFSSHLTLSTSPKQYKSTISKDTHYGKSHMQHL